LSGPALHVALETITGSRISYGKDHMPKSSPADTRETSVNELLNTDYPITWNRDRAHFKTANGRPGVVAFDADTPSPGDYSLVDVEFSIQDEFGVTGQGDAKAILATAANAIKEYIANNSPDFITFSADEPSRRKLYSRMAGRLPGYSSVQTDPYSIPVQLPMSFNDNSFMLVKNSIVSQL